MVQRLVAVVSLSWLTKMDDCASIYNCLTYAIRVIIDVAVGGILIHKMVDDAYSPIKKVTLSYCL